MKQSLKDFFEGVSIKNTLFLIIWTIGILAWIYFGFSFTETRAEANWSYQESIKLKIERTEIKKDAGVKDDVSLVQTSDSVQPIDPTGEPKNSPQGSGNSISDIIPKIQTLESSGGKNDSCLQYGKVNGYGFGIYKGHFRCYETIEEVEKEVADWFKDNLTRYTLAQSVCRYNTGKASDSCPYWEKFKSLDS